MMTPQENCHITRPRSTSQGASVPRERQLASFDNGLTDVRELDAKAALLKQLGYSGMVWRPGRTTAMLEALDRHGLEMVAIYVVLMADSKACSIPPETLAEINALRGRSTIVWLCIRGSSTDELVVPAIRELSAVAARCGLMVAIYPHFGDYIDSMESALKMMRMAGTPNIGVSFNLCHFLRLNCEDSLAATLREAADHLLLVSLNGSDGGDTCSMRWDRLIRPLGEGSFDTRRLLRLLDEIGYKGPFVLQCHMIPKPACVHLADSMRAWKSMNGGVKKR